MNTTEKVRSIKEAKTINTQIHLINLEPDESSRFSHLMLLGSSRTF